MKSPHKMKHFKTVMMFVKVYVILFTLFLGILSIYWGSYYKRTSRMKNIKYLIVTNEQNNTSISPLVSNLVTNISESASLKAVGHWELKHGLSYTETLEQVHHQKYWGAIFVPENATMEYYNAMINANGSFVSKDMVTCIYETGRDLSSVSSYMLPTLKNFQKYYSELSTSAVIQPLLSQLNSSTLDKIVSNNATSALFLTKPLFTLIDYRPSPSTSLLGPAQLGLVYSYVLSFHQFNFALRIHTYIKTYLKTKDFVIYRMLSSQVTYMILTLVYSLITLAFQVPVTHTFGNSGFLVSWAIAYLNMSALGGVNEIAALLIFAKKRSLIGFWIIFHLIINISPTFSPMVLTPKFYRYGYALPMHNTYEALKVVFYNTYKGQLGRNIGILIAWIAVANALLPFVMKYSSKVAAETAKAQEKQMADLAEMKKKNDLKKAAKAEKSKAAAAAASTKEKPTE